MRFWQYLTFAETEQLPGIARAAEAAGFHGVLVGDHLVVPAKIRSPYPYSPDGNPGFDAAAEWPDPWVAIGAMAAVTERLRFGTSVFILPARNPIQVAKSIATAAVISGGRVMLGAGAGWMAEEYELLGVDFRQRGRRYDEMVEVLRKLWRGGMVEHHGACFDFEPLALSPVPREPVPIYFGGLSAAALGRAARLGEGWIGTGSTLEEIPGIVSELTRLREKAGRSHLPFDIMLSLVAAPEVDTYRRAEELGVSDAVIWPFKYVVGPASSLEQKRAAMQAFAEKIIVPMNAAS